MIRRSRAQVACGREPAALPLQLGELSHVPDLAPVVKQRDGFGTLHLSARGVDQFDWRVPARRTDGRLDHRAAKVFLRYDLVGCSPVATRQRLAAPAEG